MTSSMHHDLNSGNPLEVPWLSGGVVQLGRQVDVPTPANRAVWDILALPPAGVRPVRLRPDTTYESPVSPLKPDTTYEKRRTWAGSATLAKAEADPPRT